MFKLVGRLAKVITDRIWLSPTESAVDSGNQLDAVTGWHIVMCHHQVSAIAAGGNWLK